MKRKLLLALILCVSTLSISFAQLNEWVDISAEIDENYTINEIIFPAGFNPFNYTPLNGIALGKNTDTNTAAAFYTNNGGIKTSANGGTWTKTNLYDGGNITIEGELLGGKAVGNYLYVWGTNGILLSTGSLGSFSRLSVVNTPDEVKETGASIIDGAFYDSTTGIITDGTSIYFTQNSGEEWTKVTLPEGVTSIRKVEYLGTNSEDFTMCAIANGGRVLKSTNTGYTWEVVGQANAEVEFTSIGFISPTKFVIAATNRNGDGVSSIWLSNTGGANLFQATQIEAPIEGKIQYSSSTEALYATTTTGTVLRSTDDGNTWASIKTSEESLIKNFTINYTDVMYAFGEEGLVEINAPDPEIEFLSITTEKPYVFYFQNLSKGMIGSFRWEFENASPSFNAQHTPSRVSFYKGGEQTVTLTAQTKVPGQTATTPVTITKQVNVEVDFVWDLIQNVGSQLNTKVIFPEGQNKIGFMCSQTSTYQGYGTISKTEDGGNTWRVVLESDWNNYILIMGFESLSFPSLNVGYACGWAGRDWDEEDNEIKDYYIYKTEDGGENWEKISLNHIDFSQIDDGIPTSPDYFSDIKFWDEDYGLVATTGKVIITEDGGKTWKEAIYEPQTYQSGDELIEVIELSPYDMAIADENTIYAAGGEGRIWKSTDKGLNWDLKSAGGPIFVAIDFYDAQKGIFACADEGYIGLTNDGGETFEYLQAGLGYESWSTVHYVNDSVIYLGGAPAVLMKSTDGGKTWESEEYPTLDTGECYYGITSTKSGVIHVPTTVSSYKRYIPEFEVEFDFILNEDSTSIQLVNKSLGFLTEYNWKVNNQTISTDYDGPEFAVEVPGTYTVILEVTGEDINTDDEDARTLFDTVTKVIELKKVDGVEELQLSNLFTLYPNPVVDALNYNINLTETSAVKVVVTDISGVEVITNSYNLTAGNYEFSENTGSWNNGVYFVQLIIDGKVITTSKIMK